MLTTKEHEDGEFYHACVVDGELDFLYDEEGDMIPVSICLCFAKEPSECCCGCNS